MKTLSPLTLVLCLFLLSPAVLSADPVSRQRAAGIAEAFFSGKGMPVSRGLNNVYQAPRKGGNSLDAGKDRPNFYVFNADKGYVIVSGSDNTPEILGYSLNGSFDYDNMPDNMKSWLDYYSSQIEYAEAHDVSAQSAPGDLRKPIEPLLTCKWGQGRPYNLKCPMISNQYCATGCVATALSQVMYYYKWPEKTTQEIPGYTCSYKGVTMNISAVPAGTEFDWDNMLPEYSGIDVTEAQQEAVATLMSVVGKALNMKYNTDGSGAYSSDIPNVSKMYFDYSEKVRFVSRSDVEGWEALIYNELAAGRPVIYSGTEENGSAGHCFVVDGCDGDRLFHVDWGWGGTEGYYLLDVLDPFAQNVYENNGEGYQRRQDAIINLVPAGQDADADYQVGDPVDLTCESVDVYGTLRTSESQSLVATFSNKGGGYYGSVYLYLSESPDFDYSTSTYLGYKEMTVKRRETESVVISWTPKAPGKYYLFVTLGAGKVLASTSVDITEGPSDVVDSGLRLSSVHMDGEDFKTKKVDPSDVNASLVDVYGSQQTANISITNIDIERWQGSFTFVVERFITTANEYKAYHTRMDYGQGTPGYTWNFSITFPDLAEGKYRLAVYADDELLSNSWHFNVYDGVEAWTGPNERTILKINGGKIAVPSDVLAVDLRLQDDLSGVTPNDNPNAIYIVNENTPLTEVLEGRNVVVEDNGSTSGYSAENIQLQEGYPYYSPCNYDAARISLVKSFDDFSTVDAQHWAAFSLPFTASEVSAGGRSCAWARGADDTEGNFWLQKLSRMSDDKAYFVCEDKDSVIAWRPYIIAVPEDMGEITFSAENVTVSSSPSAMPRTEDYRFVSDMSGGTTFDLYVMDNQEGDKFMYEGGDRATEPFGAYFLPVNDNSRPDCIYIEATKIDNMAMGIGGVSHGEQGAESVYDTGGRKLTKPQKGLNIIRQADGTTRKTVVR